jgi:hypothetical protein
LFLLLILGCAPLALGQTPVQDTPYDYDVIVVGSEPEGVAAAVAAAEEGARTLLITRDPLLGGLFVMGQMNSLDLRTQPFNYQQGLFERWWRAVGRGHSFDVGRAETAFWRLLGEAGVTVRTDAPELSPVLEGNTVVGVRVAASPTTSAGVLRARQVVDATAEMDFAAAAGASYSFGFSSLGYDERMVDTLVFRIDGVDWRALSRGVRARGRAYASVDDWVAWGHFGGYPAAYAAEEPGVRLRGLNLGRQEDGSVLVNALLIYGIDPFDPDSVQEGRARAEREAPRIIQYLARELPGFENAHYGGSAPALYIRETRHLDAQCILTVDDVLDNRVSERDVAAGGYPLDVQTLTPHDNGFVYGTPDLYGVPLCVAVPVGLDNLWVVGKAAGYDPIAASSARVVPLGMAVAEGVGVAAALAARADSTPATLVAETARVAEVRERLRARGAYVPEVRARAPVGPYRHPHYAAYRLMLSRGLAVGGYDNEPRLDAPMSAISYVYLLSNVAQRFFGDRELGPVLVAEFQNATGELTPELALAITRAAACGLHACPDALSLTALGVSPSGTLTRGEMYALAASLVRGHPELAETRRAQGTNP